MSALFSFQVSTLWQECCRRMNVRRTNRERAGDQSPSREPTTERLQEEEAWSRMDDDGAPTTTAPGRKGTWRQSMVSRNKK